MPGKLVADMTPQEREAERQRSRDRRLSTKLKASQEGPLNIQAVRGVHAQRATDAHVRELHRRLLELEEASDFYTRLQGTKIPSINANRSRPKSGVRPATPISIASDWHVGEVVSLEETLGKNHYDIAEATRRAGNYWDNILWLRKEAKRTQSCDDHVMALMGDLVSGSIHPELLETNEVPLVEQVTTAAGLILPGLRELSKDCRRLLVPCVSGNHGRITDKSRIKTGWANSLETLLYRLLQAETKDLPNVEWLIPRAENLQFDVMGHRCQIQHGTQIKSQGGIGGILVPLTRWATRAQASVYAELYFFGHFHQACSFDMVLVNGSLIGDSAYSRANGMSYRDPEQINAVIDEKRGLRRFDRVSVT
jgi:hypothetical protein